MHAGAQPLAAVLFSKTQRTKAGRAPASAEKAAPISATFSMNLESAMVGAASPEMRMAPLPSGAPPQLRIVRPEMVTARGSELLNVMKREVPPQSMVVRLEPLVEEIESILPPMLRSCALPGPRKRTLP